MRDATDPGTREAFPNADLFGERRIVGGGRNGYAADPGTGPEGLTCGDCANIKRNARFFKCGLVRATRGPGTDIRKGAPACKRFALAPNSSLGGDKLGLVLAHVNKQIEAGINEKFGLPDGAVRAAERAERCAPGWTAFALAELIRYARIVDNFGLGFIIEDVLRALPASFPPAPDARAWGAVVNTAARRGLIVKTGEFRKAATSNGSPKPVWTRGHQQESSNVG